MQDIDNKIVGADRCVRPKIIKRRKQLRLPCYDYRLGGYYFITICTQYRLHLFGEIQQNQMVLNPAGEMVRYWYHELPKRFESVACDEFICMPNHVHFVIIQGAHIGAPLQQIIQWFKTMTTNDYIKNVRNNNWPKFKSKLWQRNYYEHVIRNEKSHFEIADYIKYNPLNWDDDEYNQNPLPPKNNPI